MDGNNAFKLTVLVLFCIKFYNALQILTEKVAKIDRFEGQCVGQENLAMTFHNLSFAHVRRTMIISGKLIVKHDLNHQIEQHMYMTRCSNRELLDSCETYNNWKFDKCCELLNTKGQIWSNFVDSITPEIRCPVKAGTYSLDNATFDANLNFLPIEGWYWRINVKSFDIKTKEQLLCMNVDIEILTVQKSRVK